MDRFEEIDKRVRDKMRIDVLEQVSKALLRCKQPFGCDPACPVRYEMEVQE